MARTKKATTTGLTHKIAPKVVYIPGSGTTTSSTTSSPAPKVTSDYIPGSGKAISTTQPTPAPQPKPAPKPAPKSVQETTPPPAVDNTPPVVDDPIPPTPSYYDDLLDTIRRQEAAARAAQQARINQAIAQNQAYIPQIEQQSDRSLQEAYINYMQAKRSAPQTLSALGYTGGATESTMLGLDTGYQNTRTTLDLAREDALRQIMENEQQIRATGDASLSELAARYYGEYANLSRDALNYELQQQAISRDLAAQAETDAMNKAKLAAAYGDFSYLQALGINPVQSRPVATSSPVKDSSVKNLSAYESEIAKALLRVGTSRTEMAKKIQSDYNAGRISEDDARYLLQKFGLV